MRSILRLSLLFLLFRPVCALARASDVESAESRPADWHVIEATIKKNAIVGFSWIDQPLNRIVLIKTPTDLCAIKYLSFSRGHDTKSETVFDSGEESVFAEAEVYSKSKGTIVRLNLKRFSSLGIGRWILFGRKNDQISCGDAQLWWSYPTATGLPSDGSDVSIASTQLTDFRHIDFADPNIRWIKYDEKRKIRIQ